MFKQMMIGLLLAVNFGCDAPATAPAEYEEILGFLFEHMNDDDDEALVDGLENLYVWLEKSENFGAASSGYQISNLKESVVDALDGEDRSASGLKGISTITKSRLFPEQIAGTLTWDGFAEVVEGNFSTYERTFEEDSSCFTDRSCTAVQASSHTVSKWARVVEMDTRYTIQYRWVYTEYGWMMLHRFWLLEPAGGTLNVMMNANYYLGVLFSDGGRGSADLSPALMSTAGGLIAGAGRELDEIKTVLNCPGSLRVHANWFNVDTGDIPFDDDQILDILINTTKTDAQRIDEWIETNPERVATFLGSDWNERLEGDNLQSCGAEREVSLDDRCDPSEGECELMSSEVE